MVNIFKALGGGLLSGTKASGKFLKGTPEKRENVSTLRPEQQGLYNQAVNAGMGPGAGGAFGEAADYYRGNLSDNPSDFNAFAAPALRQYSQDIVPGISEQFAGMGSGGLSSSGFQNAQIQGATDLSERLGALRAQLRQSSAQGLQNIGQLGLGNFSQNMVTQPGSPGFLSAIAPAVGTAAGAYIGGPGGAAAGYNLGNGVSNWFNGGGSGGNMTAGSSGPYGGGGSGPAASPTLDNRYAQGGGRMQPLGGGRF
jgi:hypothetical protein